MSRTVLLCYLIVIVGIVKGNEVGKETFYNESSGHFFAHDDYSISYNETWTAEIHPPNATNIFIVIEEMIFSQNDTLIITKGNDSLNINGSKDPFSFFFDDSTLKIVVKTSNDKNTIRKFKGYYTQSGCIYQVNDTFGLLTTPILHSQKPEKINCSFVFPSQLKMSKLSVTFLHFNLSKEKFQIIINGIPYYNYTGDSIPPEIITDKKLEFNFKIHSNDTAKFKYENVLKESEYVELNTAKDSHKFFYEPSSSIGYYPSGEECHWVIKSEENTTISFKILEISLPNGATRITINNGRNQYSKLLIQGLSNNINTLKNRYIMSSGNFLWISIAQPDEQTLVLGEVVMQRNGGYRNGSGKLSVHSPSTEVIYLLEEENGENVVLNNHKGNLTANSTLYVYDDFSANSSLIIVYNSSIPHYPVISSTSRMMIIARNFSENSYYEANFKAINSGCYKMTTMKTGEYVLNGNCNNTCKWIVPPTEDMDTVISLHLHPVLFEKQDIAILSLLDATKTVIINITSDTKVLPEFYLPSSSGFLINSSRGNCSTSNDMLHASFEKIKGCNEAQKLKPGDHLSVSSPHFPDRYPLWAQCRINITSHNTSKDDHFLLTFNKIDLAATHCLRIIDNVGHLNQTVQTYEGQQSVLPGDMILSDAASVQFSAQPCNSTSKQPLNLTTSSGFSLNLLSSDCGGKITKTEGNFSTPDFPKNTTAVICVWILEVPEKGDLTNIINFTLTKDDSKDYDFKIYDGPSIHNETIENHTTSTFLSRTNSLIFIYRRNNSKSSPGIHVTFHAQACTAKCQNGLCLHEDWKCNKINDCGDNTDEIDCEAAPFVTTTSAPPPENKSYGVSPVALGLGIPIAFIIGIVAAIYLPPLIRRFRSGQYHQFRDVSADA